MNVLINIKFLIIKNIDYIINKSEKYKKNTINIPGSGFTGWRTRPTRRRWSPCTSTFRRTPVAIALTWLNLELKMEYKFNNGNLINTINNVFLFNVYNNIYNKFI
jgi:hypothetical protein